MAQSIFEPESEIYGVWEQTAPVGLLAIVDMSHPDADLDECDDPDGIYIWRLMVDQAHQGRGYGRAALDFAQRVELLMGKWKWSYVWSELQSISEKHYLSLLRQMTDISALAASANPATATAPARNMQQISNTLSFILTPIKKFCTA
ncbi:GNAT family N-acetyltransferase [Ruegeria sp. Ofav3-42]|uniref:GNAT family N-acetyltransferase n=1 Tax=Ruegeria sp. Ofav3-42 TaxID=2917759 RepID=UPI001EF65007|nr:GNAT family N-acetyltransferase [Ruegeria sp. Ofav3-42]MCG7522625.1 GNAT family N-acetyltransferase [Ruegeria sp. Ofav3-42]